MKRDALFRIAIFVFAYATIGQAGINRPGFCSRVFYRFTEVTELPLEINWTKPNGSKKTEVGTLRLRQGEPRPLIHAFAKLVSPPMVGYSLVHFGAEASAPALGAAGVVGILSYLLYLRRLEQGDVPFWRSQLVYSALGTKDSAALRTLLSELSGGRVVTVKTQVWDGHRGENNVIIEKRWVEWGLDRIMRHSIWKIQWGSEKVPAKIERVILHVEEGSQGIDWTTEGEFRPLADPSQKVTVPLSHIEFIDDVEVLEDVG